MCQCEILWIKNQRPKFRVLSHIYTHTYTYTPILVFSVYAFGKKELVFAFNEGKKEERYFKKIIFY